MRNERGAALLLAIVALAAMGAMVAGTFLAGWLELRSADAARNAATALEAAETGVAQAAAAWEPGLNRLPVGVDSPIAVGSSAHGGYRATLSRLGESLFLVRAEGWREGAAGARLSRRLVGAFMRPLALAVDHGSALTLLGAAELWSAAAVDGADHVPAGWDSLCATGAGVPPIRSAGPPVTADSGPAPAVNTDPTVTASTFTDFGTATFDQLAGMASRQVSGVVAPLGPSMVAGQCAETVVSNWGEPATGGGSVPACAGFFPLVYSPGDLSLTGGRGQGLLLVRGDLDLSGGVALSGVVVVLGRVTSSGAGGQVLGTLLVAGAGGVSRLGPGMTVSYSACAVGRALLANAVRIGPVPGGWSQLY